MYYEDNRVKDLKVAYIGGGSRGWAWGFMMDLAADAQMEGTVALYDIDHEAAEHNEIIGNKISAHPDAVSHWKYTVADTLQQALDRRGFCRHLHLARAPLTRWKATSTRRKLTASISRWAIP